MSGDFYFCAFWLFSVMWTFSLPSCVCVRVYVCAWGGGSFPCCSFSESLVEKREEDLRRNIAVKWVWAAWHHAVIKPVFWNSVSNSCAQVRWRSSSSTCRLVCEWNIFTGRSSNSGEREGERGREGCGITPFFPLREKKGDLKKFLTRLPTVPRSVYAPLSPGFAFCCAGYISPALCSSHMTRGTIKLCGICFFCL